MSDKINIFNKKKLDEIYNSIENKEKFIKDPNSEKTIYEPLGCEKCNGTGYKGRVAIFEAILMDENIENILLTNPTEREIKKVAAKQGILSLKQDGAIKIYTGVTSFKELARVIDLY